MRINCYDILGVSRRASSREIKTAFRRLAKKWHPDINPDVAGQNERFSQIREAYKILSDPRERARYDATLPPEPPKPPKPRPVRQPPPAVRTDPAPRSKEPPKEKGRPRAQPQAAPPPQDVWAPKFALYLKRLKEYFQFSEPGAAGAPRAASRPRRASSVGENKVRTSSFDQVLQTVRTRGATEFVMCSDGVIRRAGQPTPPPQEESSAGPTATPGHAWRVVLGIVLILLAKWWDQMSR